MREINLLPKSKQSELHYEKVLHALFKVVWISVMSFAVVFLAQLAVKLYLEGQLRYLQAKTATLRGQVDKNENAQIRLEINAINNRIADFKNLSDGTPKWSKVLKAFAVLPPSEVRIETFNLDFTKKMVSITGVSPTREKVIETYYNILNDSKNFNNIDYPLENVAKPTDINFHFTFYVNDSLLK